MKRISLVLLILILFSSCACADLPQRNIPASLKDVEGMIPLSDDAVAKLVKNGFVVKTGFSDEIYDVYNNCRENNQPIFVTTDSVLHTSHIFFDYLLRILEIEKLYGYAEELTNKMLSLSERQYYEARESEVKDLARLNVGYFAVAKKIFDPNYYVPLELKEIVDTELENIEKHEGIKFRALLTYVEDPEMMATPYAYEDYSQYVPRGHYTRNEMFEKYFKVLMWYGRIDFKLKPGKKEPALSYGKFMTLQAILMADALRKDKDAYKLWKKIYEPTVFFVGESDDLNVPDYLDVIKKIYPADGNVDKFSDQEKLDQFIEEAMKLKPPKIVSNVAIASDGDAAITTKGFRLMGQRFIPDSYMFQELVWGKKDMIFTGQGNPFTMEIIPNVGPARAFPRGLDIMAVLGSDKALDVLREEGDTNYKFYYEQLNKLREEFSNVSTDEWKQNLYWRWLFSLLPLLQERGGENLPRFMQSPAWTLKELQTALGSWTELRHDTILYAKQSYTMMEKSAMPEVPELTFGYVEPYPRVYGRISAMMEDLRASLLKLEIDIKGVPEKIEEFENLLSELKTISNKELEGKTLTEEEYNLIWNIGSKLASFKEFPHEIMDKITDEDVDDKMDIVADVHTDPNTKQVLEEAVGQPFNIYVIVEDAKGARLCRGAVFSYYEFKHPMDDRLTDEKWQAMRGGRPAQPGWTDSFTVKN